MPHTHTRTSNIELTDTERAELMRHAAQFCGVHFLGDESVEIERRALPPLHAVDGFRSGGSGTNAA